MVVCEKILPRELPTHPFGTIRFRRELPTISFGAIATQRDLPSYPFDAIRLQRELPQHFFTPFRSDGTSRRTHLAMKEGHADGFRSFSG